MAKTSRTTSIPVDCDVGKAKKIGPRSLVIGAVELVGVSTSCGIGEAEQHHHWIMSNGASGSHRKLRCRRSA